MGRTCQPTLTTAHISTSSHIHLLPFSNLVSTIALAISANTMTKTCSIQGVPDLALIYLGLVELQLTFTRPLGNNHPRCWNLALLDADRSDVNVLFAVVLPQLFRRASVLWELQYEVFEHEQAALELLTQLEQNGKYYLS